MHCSTSLTFTSTNSFQTFHCTHTTIFVKHITLTNSIVNILEYFVQELTHIPLLSIGTFFCQTFHRQHMFLNSFQAFNCYPIRMFCSTSSLQIFHCQDISIFYLKIVRNLIVTVSEYFIQQLQNVTNSIIFGSLIDKIPISNILE